MYDAVVFSFFFLHRRGSMCLKGEDSSEEDMTDTLYSEIDYIL